VSVVNVYMSHLHAPACEAYNTYSIQAMQYTHMFGTLWCTSFALASEEDWHLVTFLKC